VHALVEDRYDPHFAIAKAAPVDHVTTVAVEPALDFELGRDRLGADLAPFDPAKGVK